MAFTDAEKTDLRRFMGYAAFGAIANGNAGFQSWRFFQQYGLIEFRFNNMSAAEEAVARTYLTNLNTLEANILLVSNNVDTAAAAIWTRNPAEMEEREALYKSWRLKLCAFFGVEPGDYLSAGIGSVGMVI